MASRYSMRLEVKYNHFPKIARAMPQQAEDVVARTVLMLVQAADPATPVDTGNLKNNKTITTGGLKGSVHWHAPYTGFVIFGTRYMSARPFIPQAVSQVQPLFVEAMRALAQSGDI